MKILINRNTGEEMRVSDDIVEVVRCKDCIYNHNGGCTHSEIYDDENYRPDYYCADGERKKICEID